MILLDRKVKVCYKFLLNKENRIIPEKEKSNRIGDKSIIFFNIFGV